ncbi:glycerophosphodiester phosphodiesterase family protein [Blastomonas aquatica]|uniref:Glycerophosphoryl diester phosphodiesterase n=1 Tax=Blastomonas aquatica TaxID=1510276 RepID=A0ABQ1JM31_9SPHN|nr:glycerophosphodiester phosphodiesterase family protein [Blastomonas aquatica]GGB71919.1 glycerophosphoryl diester phosphodiesterase [Blastomonas aquatica]
MPAFMFPPAMLLLSGSLALQTVTAHDADRSAELERRLAGPDGEILVVAHRGCWLDTAENSLAAIDACVAMGVDMVEIDTRRTRDGVLVLMHDATVDRTTDGSGKLADLSLAEIRRLRLRSAAGGKGVGTTAWRVPTLAEALAHAKGRILVNVDAKEDVRDIAATEVQALGMARQVLFKTEAPAATLAGKQWVSRAAFEPIINQRKLKGEMHEAIASYDVFKPVAYEIVFNDIAFLDEAVATLRGKPVRIWANTLDYDFSGGHVDRIALIDPDAVWGMMRDRGVDAIQTDQPRALLAYLDRTAPALSRDGSTALTGQEQ